MIFSRSRENAVMSYGFSALLSSMKSPKLVSSSSPIGRLAARSAAGPSS
jgi:hypothetical protein